MNRLNRKDNSLDTFIQEYCAERRIRLDAKAFSVAFSGVEEYTRIHAQILIEVFADLYSLRLDSSH